MRGESYGVGYLVREAPPVKSTDVHGRQGPWIVKQIRVFGALHKCLDLAGVARVIRKSQGQDE